MKKNLFTLLTFALVVVNLVLTAIIAITIVPEVQKVNNLVTTVSNAIDLDLQAAVDADSTDAISLADIYPYDILDTMTIKLRTGDDGKTHYAIVGATLSINTNSEAYGIYAETLDDYQNIIKATIINVCSQYSYEEWQADQSAIQREIRDELNAQFGQGFVASVGFSTATLN